jgi:hypothetical protein
VNSAATGAAFVIVGEKTDALDLTVVEISVVRRSRHKVTGLQGIIICSPLKCPVRSYMPPEGYFA